jgi:hypothetical protein
MSVILRDKSIGILPFRMVVILKTCTKSIKFTKALILRTHTQYVLSVIYSHLYR